MATTSTTANVSGLDTSGSSQAVVTADLRETPNAGGSFSAEVAESAITAGTVTIPASITSIDSNNGGTNGMLNIDFREQPNAGGFIQVAAANALGFSVFACNVTLSAATAPIVDGSATLTITQ
ncbi:MAG TPA: hypothetical protein VFN49_03715 [Candidatus Aquilonibacter sp.]|nr:hypothetical protein [Candidatus Aquilonibacter sp.]